MQRRTGGRGLAAVLFTDIVGSTAIAAEMGNTRWSELVARHHRIVRRPDHDEVRSTVFDIGFANSQTSTLEVDRIPVGFEVLGVDVDVASDEVWLYLGAAVAPP